jgi:7,8-dihydropterin-6-yl-methyl-4-(beta-D-ribofuranosyl)aminobenzene 5'-phosphate synthase
MRSWTDLTVIYMRITCLVEDRARPPLRGEHGLSLHIEGDVNILFDTGQSGLFIENAELLGVDLGDVDLAIISHGHYDHGGGLTHFLDVNENAEVLIGRGAFRGRQAVEDGAERFIGVEEIMDPRVRFVDGDMVLHDGYTILKGFSGPYRRPDGNSTLLMESASGLVPDTFDDELVLVVDGPGGLTVVTGCSHNGILNILDTVRAHFPDRGIGMVVGGLHISGDAPYVASEIHEFNIGKIYTGHCTSEEAFKVLGGSADLGVLRTGTVIHD